MSGLLDVGTTKLYHEVCGSGPALLLVTGGTGGADEWAPVVPTLAEGLTVVTYDRRGMSRSPRPDGWTATSMPEQADDAAALLRALELASVTVVGHSGGASIACSLVVDHPELVRHAVLYEAPLLAVVPDGEAVVPDGEAVVAGFQAIIDQAMVEGGPRRAMEAFMRANAGDQVVDELFASTPPAQRDLILDNGAVFFPIELPAFAAFVPDRAAMRVSGVPLTVAVGAENRDTWLGAASAWLADGTGAELVELPGGHVGYMTHPEVFVELVRRVASRQG